MIELEYIEIDGLLYPDIRLDNEELYNDLGKYGFLICTNASRGGIGNCSLPVN